MKKTALLLLAFLPACHTYSNISVKHLYRANGVPESRYDFTSDVYVLIDQAAITKEAGFIGSSFSNTVDKKTGSVTDETKFFDTEYLGRLLSIYMTEAGGHVAAFRAVSSNLGEDPFIPALKPKSYLSVRLHSYQSTEVKHDPVVKVTVDKKTKKETKTVEPPVWDVAVKCKADIELWSLPDKTKVVAEMVEAEVTKSLVVEDNNLPLEERAELNRKLMDNTASRIVRNVRPVNVLTYGRPIFPEPHEVPKAQNAYRAAENGNWGIAEEIWRAKLAQDPSSWRAHLGLGVAYERKQEFAIAKTHYEKARDLSAGTTEVKKINFNGLIASIPAAPTFAPQTHVSDGWFGRRVAVLLFSDEVVSIDGPENVREQVWAKLKNAGYNMIPLAEVNETLRTKGFSDGAQLVLVKPEELASWLRADLLVFGHIDDFSDQNVGVYRKRSVGGEIKFWDATAKKFVISSSHSVHNKKYSDKPGSAFIWGLLESWVERASKNPLANELLAFVQINLQSWPLR